MPGATGRPGSTAATPMPRTQPVTLRFMSARGDAMSRFTPVWNDYGSRHKITFEVERAASLQDLNTKLTAMYASDSAPDVNDAFADGVARFYDAGFVLQLDQYLARDKVNLEREWALTGIERWRSKTYALPYWAEPFSIYYNKTLFHERGVPDPWERATRKGEWTLEEMLDAARRLTDESRSVRGLEWDYTSYHSIAPFIWTRGDTPYDYDTMTWRLDKPISVEAHQQMLDWTTKTRINLANEDRQELLAPFGGRGLNNGGSSPFVLGKTAIHYRSVNDWSRMGPAIKDTFAWDVLPVPSIAGKPGAAWSAGHPVTAWSKTRYPEDAWQFMKWLADGEFQGFLAKEQILVPAKKDAQPVFFRPPEQNPYQHPTVFADVYRKPYGIGWRHFGAAENATTYSREMQRIYKGEVALTSGLQELNRLLQSQVDYGGGENPFKGLRLPIQPR